MSNYFTCCKHESWFDHLNGVGAELFKVWDASWVVKSTNVNIGHLELHTHTHKNGGRG